VTSAPRSSVAAGRLTELVGGPLAHLAEQAVLAASDQLAAAKDEYATAFLRAKISKANPTDRQAEASATVEAGQKVQAAEASYFIATQRFAAAIRQKGA